MNTLENGFFALCTLFVLIGGVFTVAAKNPIRGAMGLLGTILGIAGMYLLLSAELLAAIQVVVYAGAVVILFLFVIMLLGPAAVGTSDARGAISRYLGAVLFLFSAAGALYVIMFMGKELTQFAPAPAGMGTIELIGREIFSRDVVPFQIAGVLLLVAVIGAMSVAKGKSGEMFLPDIGGRKAPPPAKNVRHLTTSPSSPFEMSSKTHVTGETKEGGAS